jgi:hypothetical protein
MKLSNVFGELPEFIGEPVKKGLHRADRVIKK